MDSVTFLGRGGFPSWSLPKGCGERANLCHLLKPPGSSSLLGELLILSLLDLTRVPVLCLLACRKCCLLIHSWGIILLYLWLLSLFLAHQPCTLVLPARLKSSGKMYQNNTKHPNKSSLCSLPPCLNPKHFYSSLHMLLCEDSSLSHWFHCLGVFNSFLGAL